MPNAKELKQLASIPDGEAYGDASDPTRFLKRYCRDTTNAMVEHRDYLRRACAGGRGNKTSKTGEA